MTTKEYENLIKFLKDYCKDYIFRLPNEEEIKELDYFYGILHYEWKSPCENITIEIADNLNTDELILVFKCHDENLVISRTIKNIRF